MKDFRLDAIWANDVLKAFLKLNGNFGLAITSILDGTIPVSRSTMATVKRRETTLVEYASIAIHSPILVTLRSYMLELSFNAGIMKGVGEEATQLIAKEPILYRVVKKLAVIPGLTESSAVQIIAEVGNISRFHGVKGFLKYVGYAPAQHISGESSFAGHLAKRINHISRNVFITAGKVLVESVQKDSDLKEQARKILNAHINDKKLVYANVAAKIARVVYAIVYKGGDYEPFHVSRPDQKGLAAPPKDRKSLNADQIQRKISRKTNALISSMETLLGDSTDPMHQELSLYFKECTLKRKDGERSGKR